MTIQVPFFDLNRQNAKVKAEMLSAFEAVYETTAFCGGDFVDNFENNFKAYTGALHCAAVNNGTNAIYAVLNALGLGPGDEVIVPASTFIASAWGVNYCGAKVLFVDVDPQTWTIDPVALEKAINSRTRAVIGVHLYGTPFAVNEILAITKRHGIHLIEDCAQAHGATFEGKHVGQFGVAGCYSFYPSKNLGACGEGGAVVTADSKLDRHVRMSRNQGSEERYHHEILGFNMRLNGMQAAMLDVKLLKLPEWVAKRREIAKAFARGIENPALQFQKAPQGANPSPHLFVVQVQDRAAFVTHMLGQGVQTALHYPVPCHLQPVYRELGYKMGDLPISEQLAARCVSLPLFPELFDEEVRQVIMAANKFSPKAVVGAAEIVSHV